MWVQVCQGKSQAYNNTRVHTSNQLIKGDLQLNCSSSNSDSYFRILVKSNIYLLPELNLIVAQT